LDWVGLDRIDQLIIERLVLCCHAK
jgi:hypothetical protein